MTVRSGINPADLVTAAGFLLVVAVAMAVTMRKGDSQSPRARMLKRARDTAAPERAPGTVIAGPDAHHIRPRSRWHDSPLAAWANMLKTDIMHMAGVSGLYWMATAALAAIIIAAAAVKFSGLSAWFGLLVAPLAAAAGTRTTVTVLRAIYRRRFLAGFPDALELIIRAVRAGVPVVQAIRTAGKELPDPVGHEFRLMGDALRLGLDQDEVLLQACKRISLPDFHFFTVCLQLQRETGGPLAETMENLAAIIRARREVLLKTQALTAQGRMSSKVIAMVPVVVMSALQLTSDGYLDILFETPTGHTVLWIAGSMVLTGLLVINRMAKLED